MPSAATVQSAGPAISEKLSANLSQAGDDEARWLPVLGLPCAITVALEISGFKVRDFQTLRPGSVIATGFRVTRDVPLRVNGALIGWGEFDGSGNRLAVRLTELA